ncbi:MAG TPA: hypothetical protein VJV78_12450 [Polyangiales bacterium]|nr:hypothetical protein [Polyangiales bacterium]
MNAGQGSWQGLIIGRDGSTDSVLSNLQLVDGGFDRPVLDVHQTVALQDVLV